jgi:hypothetical protein
MSDEQFEVAFELLQGMVDQRLGEKAKLVEGVAETVALPAPDVVPDGLSKVMDATDASVRPRERKPRKAPSSGA